jgi:hypothetical protein
MKTVFYIENYLPATVATRQSIKLIDNKLSLLKDKNVIINFKNIDFISRAFADELIHFLNENRIKPQFTHTNQTISEILNTVVKNRNKKNKTFHHIAKTEIKDKNQLDLILSLL